MHAPLRVFATLALLASVVAPALATPVGYVFGPSKRTPPIDLFGSTSDMAPRDQGDTVFARKHKSHAQLPGSWVDLRHESS